MKIMIIKITDTFVRLDNIINKYYKSFEAFSFFTSVSNVVFTTEKNKT